MISSLHYLRLFMCIAFIYKYCFLKFIYFIYLFLAALGLHCCMWVFSSCGEWGLLFVAAHGLLIAVASLVVVVDSRCTGFSSCGTRPWFLRGMWNLPGPGLKPMFPALAGGFLTTVPPGKPYCF